ncbi:hypothetical protein ACF07D_15925 [Leucobacter sp. NPDC015123]|uniref:hypothetical protein n=1 Tax=Leucobacter sp. NPDC015123 TaxID=3364129 RepID=UPI0036F4608A
MAKELSVEEAIDRARRAQEDRIEAIRVLAEARHELDTIREDGARELAELQARIAERVSSAERDDVKAYNAAVSAGWNPDELRKIGFSEPDKKTRARKRAPRKTAAQSSPRTPAVSTTPSGLESDFKLSDVAAPQQPATV